MEFKKYVAIKPWDSKRVMITVRCHPMYADHYVIEISNVQDFVNNHRDEGYEIR